MKQTTKINYEDNRGEIIIILIMAVLMTGAFFLYANYRDNINAEKNRILCQTIGGEFYQYIANQQEFLCRLNGTDSAINLDTGYTANITELNQPKPVVEKPVVPEQPRVKGKYDWSRIGTNLGLLLIAVLVVAGIYKLIADWVKERGDEGRSRY